MIWPHLQRTALPAALGGARSGCWQLAQITVIDWLVTAVAVPPRAEGAAGTRLTAPHLQRTFLPALSSATRSRTWQDGHACSIDIDCSGQRRCANATAYRISALLACHETRPRSNGMAPTWDGKSACAPLARKSLEGKTLRLAAAGALRVHRPVFAGRSLPAHLETAVCTDSKRTWPLPAKGGGKLNRCRTLGVDLLHLESCTAPPARALTSLEKFVTDAQPNVVQ